MRFWGPPYSGPPYSGPPYWGPPYWGPPYWGPPYSGPPYPLPQQPLDELTNVARAERQQAQSLSQTTILTAFFSSVQLTATAAGQLTLCAVSRHLRVDEAEP